MVVQTVLLRSILIQSVRKRKSGKRLQACPERVEGAGMGPSWGHAGLSFLEVLITLASKDSPTIFAGHVACAAFADDAGKTTESLGSRDSVLCACFTVTHRTVGRSGTGAGRCRRQVRTSSIFTDHAPAQATCPAQCYRYSFLSDSGIWPAQRRPSPFPGRPSAAFQEYVWTVLLCSLYSFLSVKTPMSAGPADR